MGRDDVFGRDDAQGCDDPLSCGEAMGSNNPMGRDGAVGRDTLPACDDPINCGDRLGRARGVAGPPRHLRTPWEDIRKSQVAPLSVVGLPPLMTCRGVEGGRRLPG